LDVEWTQWFSVNHGHWTGRLGTHRSCVRTSLFGKIVISFLLLYHYCKRYCKTWFLFWVWFSSSISCDLWPKLVIFTKMDARFFFREKSCVFEFNKKLRDCTIINIDIVLLIETLVYVMYNEASMFETSCLMSFTC